MTAGRPDYTQVSLIRGNCSGVGLVTVAVDSSGNIVGILKGDYGGTLKTLAVDDQGHMLAVLTDPQDVFGNEHYLGAAELAARLGSPCILDRQGQVIFMDPGGVNVGQYVKTVSGASGAFVEDGSFGILGPLCYKLTAGPAENDYVKITKAVPRVSLTGMGLEAVMCVDADVKYVTLSLVATSLTTRKTGKVRIDLDALNIEYYKSDGTWDTLASAVSALVITEAHVFKLTLNPFSGKYMAFRWGDEVIDMSAYSLYSETGAYSLQLVAGVQVDCDTGGDTEAYLGPLIITCKEV